MAKDILEKSDYKKSEPVNETLATEQPVPDIAPPAKFDIPASGDVVVPFEKINELVSEHEAAEQPAEQPAPEKQEQEATVKKRGDKSPKANKTDKPDKEPKPEKQPKADKSAKEPKTAAEKTTAPEPEKPPEPREAPRNGEQEQIVYLNLSKLYAFKNHPLPCMCAR